MNCGVFCVQRYLQITNLEDDGIIAELNARVTDRGLSLLALKEVLERHGFSAGCYYDRKPQYCFPLIMLDAKRGHYYLVYGREGNEILMSDSTRGDFRIHIFFFKVFWSYYYLTVRQV